ncbi:MAG: drug/metabolite exporter YedA [Actinomycetota bacterium]|nr:MAG: drug/metabolite exporter YedA [Actinomycetota bacterium]
MPYRGGMSRPAAVTSPRPRLAAIWVALGAVYLIWGTTYFAIRVVNQTLPPLLSAAVRFLVAGAVLYAWAVSRGDAEGDRATRAHWRSAALVGLLLVVGGNGAVVWAERTIPSGLTALIIALVPLWMALLDRLFFGGRLRPRAALGLVAGFGGAALLLGVNAAGDVHIAGMLVAVGASLSWATGSLVSRTAHLPRRPLVGVGMQMLVGGAALALAGLLAGELGKVHVERFSRASVLALAYLIVVGSWGGFSAYLWLLRVTRTSLVSTYAYVNPVVAVFLGWLILGERVGLRTVLAGGIVLASVAAIISAGGAHRELEPELATGVQGGT